jgi:hypothetical protein
MISTTWTKAPADLLGLGGLDVRRYAGVRTCGPVAPMQGTGVSVEGTVAPFGGIAARLRPAVEQPGTQALAHNFIGTDNGTTLGIHSSRRPQS